MSDERNRRAGRKTLLLLRHAKSSWDVPALRDHDRPLAPRGRRAARLMAREVAPRAASALLVLCSTARRARDTLEPLRQRLPRDAAVGFERALYLASAEALLARLRRIAEDQEAVLLVGHNPGLQELALALAGRRGPGAARARLRAKFPTGALAVYTFEGRWRDLAPRAARLVAFTRPRDLA